MRPTARVARGATYLFVQGFVNALSGVVYFSVLTHALSDRPEEVGVYALVVFVLTLPQIFGTFGLPSAAVKYISQYMAENNPDKAKSVITRTLQIGLLSSTVAFVLLFVPAEWLSIMMFKSPEYALILRIVALTSVFSVLMVLASSFLQGLQKMPQVATIGFTYALVQNSVGIFLLYLGWRLYAVVACWLAGLAVASIAGLIITAKYLGIFGKPHEIKPLLQFSIPLYISGGIGFMVGWIDQLFLVSYLSSLPAGAREAQRILGIYRVALQAATVPSLFSTAIMTALFPKLSELYTQQGLNSLRDAFRVSIRYLVLIGFPMIIGLATLAKPTVTLIAGSQYVEAAGPLIVVSIASLLAILGVAVSPILMTLERTNIVSALSIISVISSAFLSYVFLAYLGLGMIGTAWARTIVTAISLALSLYVLTRHVPISFDKEALWKASAASAFMVLAILGLDLVRKLLSSDSYQFLVIRLQMLPIYALFGALAYFLCLIALRAIKKHDIELVEDYLPKNLRRMATWLERFAAAD